MKGSEGGRVILSGAGVVLLAIGLLFGACASSGDLFSRQVASQRQAASGPSPDEGESEPAESPEPPEPGISISGSPYGASIYIDGIYTGTAPLTVTPPMGGHWLRAEKNGYRDQEIFVDYDGKSAVSSSYSLEELKGFVQLSVDPADAEVTVEGYGILVPGINEIPVGDHEARCTRFGFSPGTSFFRVEELRTTFVDMRLEPKGLDPDLSVKNPFFNPLEAGKMGETVITVEPDSFGYVRIRILDPRGGQVLSRTFPFLDRERQLKLVWDGIENGKAYPVGSYGVMVDYWSMREPLPAGDFPDGAPDGTKEEALAITDELQTYGDLLSQVSGLSYCPDASFLGDSFQLTLSNHGSYVSPALWLDRISIAGRLGLGRLGEASSSVGLSLFPGEGPSFDAAVAVKFRLWEKAGGSSDSSGALYLRGSFLSDGVVIDPFGAMKGFSAGLPMEISQGLLDIVVCPELGLSPYSPNHPESSYADIYSHSWYPIPYLRGGLRYRTPGGTLGASAFWRFEPLTESFFRTEPPFGIAIDAILAESRSGTRLGVSALAQLQDADNWYVMLGLSLGSIWPTGG